MHHKSIGPSWDHLRQVEAAISVHFHRQVTLVDIFEVGSGANGSAHYVAQDATGARWGLKASVRGIPEGTEREVTIADLAQILDIPNAPSSALCTLGAFQFRTDLRFAITPWLAGAKSLSGLDAAERAELVHEATSFGRQFGEWLAFGLLFGIGDRHAGNWAWVPGSRRLAMIDMEDCMAWHAHVSQYHVFKDYLEPPSDVATAVREVRVGVDALFNKLRERGGALTHRLAHANFATAAPYMALYPTVDAVFDAWTAFYDL